MAGLAAWERWERDVQQQFGLDATICSGNKFYDSGDAVDNAADSPWPQWVDAKHTTGKAFPVAREEILSLHERAELLGKKFVLAVRFTHPRVKHSLTTKDSDYVLIPKDDYIELVDSKREGGRT